MLPEGATADNTMIHIDRAANGFIVQLGKKTKDNEETVWNTPTLFSRVEDLATYLSGVLAIFEDGNN